MFKAPAILFPTTIVFLDDDSLYIKMLFHRLMLKNMVYYENADNLVSQGNYDFLYAKQQNIIRDNLSEISYLKKNFERIKTSGELVSVVVSDLFMNNLLGTELFTSLKSPYIGKILASNFMSYQNNIDILESINEGKIDIILDKTKNFVEELPKAILAAKNKFFTAISNELFSHEISNDHPLADTEFASMFLKIIEEYKPEEIIPNKALNKFTFIFDDFKTPVSIHINSENDINAQLLSAAAESAPKSIISNLSTGQYILCPEENDDTLPDGYLWPLLIRPAKKIETKNNRFLYCISEVETNEVRNT